ncbi:IclR family transcriptional regulator domain-containing protein, partial [Paraburkholderia strydomiana]|uniref:IclR family transcriptional regulator domain-containing protein n=1 Tax=Paraburkholderia strydomiana TaxID=1245417 RepID=UPI0038BBD7CB
RSVRASIRVGEEFVIEKGASGKVLLAFTEPQDSRWNETRAQLWAVSYGERDPETASVSVPVFGATGELVGAHTVSGPKGRFDVPTVIATALRNLLENAKRATVALGGNGGRYEANIALAKDEAFLVSRS